MSQQIVVAGLLGLGLAAAILKQITQLSKKAALMIVMPAVILGAIMSTVLKAVMDGGGKVFVYEIQWYQWFYIGLVLFIVFMRIKQSRA
ncbi:MAG TPA: hypothetical protein PKD05_24395 [Candidatus Melainabacteria bacterium]|nr:hypothetical protein [Candidatus Melainabacteria bacterium]HMP54712.1 hypothetical protein [Candidatus Melainabacteria bacterium]